MHAWNIKHRMAGSLILCERGIEIYILSVHRIATYFMTA